MVKNTLIWLRALYVFGSILVVPPIVGATVAGIVYGVNVMFCVFASMPIETGYFTMITAGLLGTASFLFTTGLLIYNLVNEWTAIKTHIVGKKE